ncbi:hypothetical protein KOW79_013961 [Hemibagrus wyckioides]|uniref:Uncharacterized protein n=1 Tax=Hemibagrus wyckioides TaxID=337641 RepID=A0A9D3NIA5_9TELE|nr:hypothetical protein KOW79_013961 [Hemibagrus wyckioides]
MAAATTSCNPRAEPFQRLQEGGGGSGCRSSRAALAHTYTHPHARILTVARAGTRTLSYFYRHSTGAT